MDDVKHISHSLCWVVNVTLKVYKCRFLLKNSVLVSFCYSVNNFVHVFVTFSDVHIITDTDNISHEGDHVSCLTNCLTVSNLRFSFVKILNFKTKKVTSRSERETCTCGIVTEQRNSKSALKYLCGNVVLSHVTKSISYCKYSLDLVVCFLPCKEEVTIVHLFEVECVQFVNISL